MSYLVSIEIGCVVTSLVVGHWLVVTRVHCGQTVHPMGPTSKGRGREGDGTEKGREG